MPRQSRWLYFERVCLVCGVICLASWAAQYAGGAIGMRQELDRFGAVRAAAQATPAEPDLSLWSPERIKAWRATLAEPSSPPPLGVLRIRRLHIEVPILEGTDDRTLDRGAGHIADTAAPGTDGNSGIAAHRDGYFRALKDITTNDVVELETARGIEQYHVERTWVVAPEDVSVLDPTNVRSLTLVTCYPFYFVGSAPRRFIVRAVR